MEKKRVAAGENHRLAAKPARFGQASVIVKGERVDFTGKMPAGSMSKDKWMPFQAVWQNALQAYEAPRVFVPAFARSPEDESL